MSDFKQYRRKELAELRPFISRGKDFPLDFSISSEDIKAGSPKPGDMIARNPKNHADKWLVAAQYFADNFEDVKVTEILDLDKQNLRYNCLISASKFNKYDEDGHCVNLTSKEIIDIAKEFCDFITNQPKIEKE